jgi:hypothetical protein
MESSGPAQFCVILVRFQVVMLQSSGCKTNPLVTQSASCAPHFSLLCSLFPRARTPDPLPRFHPPSLRRKPAWQRRCRLIMRQSSMEASPIRQREPYEGETATEKTEVRILYTRTAVYFSIHCYDSDRSRIVATELRRDAYQNLDDHFEFLIDSNHDHRDAYVFEINPLGTQSDGLIADEYGAKGPPGQEDLDFDPGWDGVWTSEVRITSDGWTATVEVPFSTLNFTQSKDMIWGMNFKRFIRRKNEENLWTAYRRTFGITKVSQAGELRGITDIGSGRLPYAPILTTGLTPMTTSWTSSYNGW